MATIINMNEPVRVKLNELGLKELKRQHDELNEYIIKRGGKPFEDYNVEIDEDGYTSFQWWQLMNKFGHLMAMGSDAPFELNVLYEL